jgi:hypothetical protein
MEIKKNKFGLGHSKDQKNKLNQHQATKRINCNNNISTSN